MITPILDISTTGVHCKTDSRTGSGAKAKDKPQKAEHADRFLLCRQCLAYITSPAERTVVGGAHQHAFANPHGVVFEIGCFRNAPGCGAIGAPTNEFTWFGGYFWQVAICGSCLAHMGWRFTSADSPGFYGLILDRLVESVSD